MKKLLSILTVLLISFVLVACENTATSKLAELKEALEIQFKTGDSYASVTDNFTVVTSLEEATINWLTSDPNTVSISGTTGTVVRGVEDQEVTVTAIISLAGDQENKTFD